MRYLSKLLILITNPPLNSTKRKQLKTERCREPITSRQIWQMSSRVRFLNATVGGAGTLCYCSIFIPLQIFDGAWCRIQIIMIVKWPSVTSSRTYLSIYLMVQKWRDLQLLHFDLIKFLILWFLIEFKCELKKLF